MDGDSAERRLALAEEAGGRSAGTHQLSPEAEKTRARLSATLKVDVPASVFAAVPIVDDAESTTRLLRSLLRKGILKVGTEIAGEPLADVLDVHRNTISKVLRTLEDEGYLHRRRGRPARVVAVEPILPKRRTKRISHTKLAEDHHLEIRSVAVRCEERTISKLDIDPEERSEVAARLALPHAARVIVYSRIRELRVKGGEWKPAIAETAYFAEERAPEDFFDGLRRRDRDSIHQYLEEHGIAPITSEYRIRIAPLPLEFSGEWAMRLGVKESALAAARFLRFESTTHCNQGPIELSIASLAEGLFTLATTDLSVAIETALLSLSPKRLAYLRGPWR